MIWATIMTAGTAATAWEAISPGLSWSGREATFPPAMTTIWIDGKFFDRDTAVVSVFDHGLLYGDGVFEGIRAYNGRIFRLGAHLDRLYDSAKGICLDIPIPKPDLAKIVTEAYAKSGMRDAYVRLVITRGVRRSGARSS